MRAILVSGKAESGKDYVSDMIQVYLQERDYSVFRIAFADYLKFICEKYLNWNGKKDEAGRDLLQHIGNDVCRKYYDGFFCDKVLELLLAVGSDKDFALITDLRYENEYSIIASKINSISVLVERKGYTNKLTEKQKRNESENGLNNFKFDYIVENNKNVTENIISIMEDILNG